jgi:NitT/TauT family transport system substrate-binding protein
MLRIAVIALAGLVFSTAQARPETLKLVIPQKGNWNSSMAEYGARKGFFRDEGLDLAITYTDGGANTEQAVVSGSADLAVASGLLGIISAYVKGAPIRVISASMTGASDIYFFARADSGIKSLADATGKTIGYSAPGSSSNLITLALIRHAGVAAQPVAAGGIPAIFTQVMSGQLDIGHAVPPLGLKEVAEGKIVIVAQGNDVPELRDQTVRVNVVNLTTLQTRRDAVRRFARAYDRTLSWAYTGGEAIAMFAADNRVSEEIARRTVEDFVPRATMQEFEIKGLQRTLDDAYDAKRLSKKLRPPDIAGLFDFVHQPLSGASPSNGSDNTPFKSKL